VVPGWCPGWFPAAAVICPELSGQLIYG